MVWISGLVQWSSEKTLNTNQRKFGHSDTADVWSLGVIDFGVIIDAVEKGIKAECLLLKWLK